MLKVYGINFFSIDPLPLKEYVLYTQLNVDNYGWSLMFSLSIHMSGTYSEN